MFHNEVEHFKIFFEDDLFKRIGQISFKIGNKVFFLSCTIALPSSNIK